ncbi:acyl-CoA thioesterase [Rubrimonas cliftonensis]|uniref:Acyl-CoA thioester hydrolase n=1 Tax=Rubrimonas cliftonensis TaxID=89524 RepID=A0A1H3XDU8_9RHOB|nr:thioesterase family protein [Rubrimonas cliftonensis]SDZ97519.1 acyl-CoA thioester hydrolase [Rubrimonas cliftonensis]
MPPSPPRPLEAFPARVSERLRYRDTDRQGHVNNAVYATLFEIGRVDFLLDPDRPPAPAGAQFVIVRLAMDFRRELRWPGTVEIATGVTRIGARSIAMEQGVYLNGEAAATAESVVALMDDASRRAVDIPATTRAALEASLLPAR